MPAPLSRDATLTSLLTLYLISCLNPQLEDRRKQFHVLISSIQELQRILDGELFGAVFFFFFNGIRPK